MTSSRSAELQVPYKFEASFSFIHDELSNVWSLRIRNHTAAALIRKSNKRRENQPQALLSIGRRGQDNSSHTLRRAAARVPTTEGELCPTSSAAAINASGGRARAF